MLEATPDFEQPDLNHELEQVLRHLVARAHEHDTAGDVLLGVGAQLVYSTAGVRYMSLKSDIDHRVQELVTAIALIRAAQPQCVPEVLVLLTEATRLLELAQTLTAETNQILN